MPSLLLALVVAAWPLPRDAGVAEYAQPASWPAEPGWLDDWPLLSFPPPGSDGGAGLRVDVAWSVTRGRPSTTLAVIGPAHALGDGRLARARLNPGEVPDAGDANGDGVFDLHDLAGDPRVPDSNGNGALDPADVLAAFADGRDDDGNGYADDVSGWDFARDAPPADVPDAGSAALLRLVAPVDDGLPGIGVCPECTVLPIVAPAPRLPDAVGYAVRVGARVVVLLPGAGELPLELFTELERHPAVVFVTPGGPGPAAPLELHPRVLVPRALDPLGAPRPCGGQRARLGVSAPGCGEEAALLLAGVAGLVLSVAPDLSPAQLAGLLGGRPLDAARAVTLAEQPLPPAPAEHPPLQPRWGTPESAASGCALEAGPTSRAVPCEGGAPLAFPLARPLAEAPWGVVVDLVESSGPLRWTTPLLAAHAELLRGLSGINHLGWGAAPPRLVDIDGLGSDAALALAPSGLVGLTAQDVVETIAPLPPGRPLTPAYGDLLDDRRLDVVTLTREGLLDAWAIGGAQLAGFAVSLGAVPAGPPVLATSRQGTSLVTATRDGLIEVRRGAAVEWQHALGAPVLGPLAAGDVDGDGFLDVAVAADDGLHVLFGDPSGPRSVSWRRQSQAAQVLLGDLDGDGRLELVADRVFGWSGEERLTLDGWTLPLSPPALARLDTGPNRSLVQLEAGPGASFQLVRYDVEAAVRSRSRFASRVVLTTLQHPPARGGFAVADVSGDRRPDVILPTEDGLLFVVDGRGALLADSPRPALGSVEASPAVGVFEDELTIALRTTRGDLVRFAGVGFPVDLVWEGAGHDRGNTNNAEAPLPPRRLGGLGITEPPRLAPQGCGCGAGTGPLLLGLLLAFGVRVRRKSC